MTIENGPDTLEGDMIGGSGMGEAEQLHRKAVADAERIEEATRAAALGVTVQTAPLCNEDFRLAAACVQRNRLQRCLCTALRLLAERDRTVVGTRWWDDAVVVAGLDDREIRNEGGRLERLEAALRACGQMAREAERGPASKGNYGRIANVAENSLGLRNASARDSQCRMTPGAGYGQLLNGVQAESFAMDLQRELRGAIKEFPSISLDALVMNAYAAALELLKPTAEDEVGDDFRVALEIDRAYNNGFAHGFEVERAVGGNGRS